MKNNLLSYVSECEGGAADSVVILEGDVQDAVTQARDAETVVDQVSEDLRSANNAIDSLYRLAGTIEDSITNSAEVNSAVTAVAEVALEQIYQSIGVPKPRSLSMEAGFLQDAKAGISKIKDHAIRILAAILEAFRKAVEWITDYLKKVSGAAGRLSDRAKALERSLGSVKGKPRNDSFKDMGLARALSKGDNLEKSYRELSELVEDAAKVSWNGTHVALLNQIIEEFSKSEKKDIDAVLKLAIRVPDVLNKTYGNIFKRAGDLVEIAEPYAVEGTDVYTTEYLPGGYLGVLVLPTGLNTLRHLNFMIRRDEDAATNDAGDGVMKTLEPRDIKTLLTLTEATCSSVEEHQRFDDKLKVMSNKLTKAAETLKKSPEEMDQKYREVLGVVAIMAPYIAKGIHSRVFGFAVSSSAAVLRYCEKCIEQYGDEKTYVA